MIRGDRIHDLRAAHGMTMETLGKKIGVSKATIKRYENGIIQNVPSDKIEAIAEALETTPEYLMGWDEPEKKEETITIKNDDVRLLAAGLDKMSEADRRRATEMFNLMFELNMDFFQKGEERR